MAPKAQKSQKSPTGIRGGSRVDEVDREQQKKQQGPTEVTRVQFYTTAFVAPSNVFRTDLKSTGGLPRSGKRPRLHTLQITGVGVLEGLYSGSQRGLSKTSNSEGIDGEDGSDADDGEVRRCNTDGSATHDLLARHFTRAQRRTLRLRHSAVKWNDYFEPLVRSFRRVLGGPEASAKGLLVWSDASLAVPSCHPFLRLLQHLGTSCNEVLAEASCSAISELLRHCYYCTGAASLELVAELLRDAFDLQSIPSWASSLFNVEKSREMRTHCLESRRPTCAEIRRMTSPSCLESPEFNFALPGFEPGGDGGFLQTRSLEPMYSLDVSSVDGMSPQFASTDELIDSSAGFPTKISEQRLDFWRGFFSYRELGTVSRALAQVALVPGATEIKDGDEEASAMTMLSNLKYWDSNESLHISSAKTFPKVFFSEDMLAESPLDQLPKMHTNMQTVFPALDERRNRNPRKILRRPAAATAVPLPIKDRRYVQEPSDQPKPPSVNSQSPTTPRSARNQIAFSQKTSPGEDVLATGEPEANAPADTWQPLPPMFMGGVEPTRRARSPPLPFVSHGVGFDQQIFAQGKKQGAVDISSGSRGGINVTNKPKSNAKSPMNSHYGKFQFDRQESPGARAESRQNGESRCAYCIHHGIEGQAEAPMGTYKGRSQPRHLQRKSIRGQIAGAAVEICTACGGSLDVPFRPRRLQINFEELVDEVGRTLIAVTADLVAALTDSGPDATSSIEDTSVTGALGAKLQETPTVAPAVGMPTVDASEKYDKPPRHISANVAFAPPRTDITLGPSTTSANALLSDSNHYFLACERLQARPLAHVTASLPDIVEPLLVESSCTVMVSMRNADLDNHGLRALVEDLTQRMVKYTSKMVHIDLCGNRLTDSCVRELLSQLEPLECARGLETLDLSKNRMLTKDSLEPFRLLLSGDKLPRLQALRLSGIDLGDAFAQLLFAGLDAAASSTLTELDVSFTGLGRMSTAGPLAAAGLIRQCSQLWLLDVSGNHFTTDTVGALGGAIVEAGALQTLHIAHNTGRWASLTPSVRNHREYSRARRANAGWAGAAFQLPETCALGLLCEHLIHMRRLRYLDLREAGVDPTCAFLLAGAVVAHPELEVLLLSGNPLGVYGVRALLSLLMLKDPAAGQKGLGTLTIEPLVEESMLSKSNPPLCFSNPSGSYALDMREAAAREVVRYCLQKWSATSGLSFEQAFISADLDGKAFKEPARLGDGIWELPRTGNLNFTVLLPTKSVEDLSDGRSFSAFLESSSSEIIRPHDRARCTLPSDQEAKVMQLLVSCRRLDTLMAITRAIVTDFHISLALAEVICALLGQLGGTESRELQVAVAEMVLDSAVFRGGDGNIGSDAIARIVLDLIQPARKPTDLPQKDAKVIMDFLVADNPTGHYVLNLEILADHIAAERLLLVNTWAVEIRRMQCRPDVSQTGNYQCLRNEAFNAERFVYQPDWVPPSSGMLEFDLAVPNRPPKGTKALPEDAWTQVVEIFRNSGIPVPLRLLCLRYVSPGLVITCQQLLKLWQELVDALKGVAGPSFGSIVLEQLLLTTLFFNIRDYGNAWQTFFASKGALKNPLLTRACENALGKLNVLDIPDIHSRAPAHLYLSLHEDRQVSRALLAVAYSEGGKAIDPKCFPGCAYGPSEGALQPIGAPPDWWAKGSPPLLGVFSVVYAADEGNVKFRRKLARQYCGWEF